MGCGYTGDAIEQAQKIVLALIVADIFLLLFLTPVLSVELPSNVWYPYNHGYQALGSLTYRFMGSGAVYWSPNHYWIYFGPSVVQLSNSSDSALVIGSADLNGGSIFGYYVIVSDAQGHVLSTAYTTLDVKAVAGKSYTVQVEGFGTCKFDHWSGGKTAPDLTVIAGSGAHAYTAVFSC